MDVPVLIITYKRFDFVLDILQYLKSVGVRKVYISIDHYNRDVAAFKPVEAYLESTSFDYQLLKWDTNVGCDRNVMEGINWFFSKEKQGIILEDDCLPTEGFASALAQLQQADFRNQNISFFSTGKEASVPFSWSPVYLPFFWGWYTTAAFFQSYYQFYSKRQNFLSIFFALRKAGLSTKLLLITLINFYAHRSRKRGVAWDSQLFLYSIIQQAPFLMPSRSLINNLGFGELSNAFTHTQQIPAWYKLIQFQHEPYNVDAASIKTFCRKESNGFLESFYADYSNSYLKLSAILVNHYLRYLKRK